MAQPLFDPRKMSFTKSVTDAEKHAGLTTAKLDRKYIGPETYFLNTEVNPRKSREVKDQTMKRTSETDYRGLNSKNIGRQQSRGALGSIVYHDALMPGAGSETVRQYFVPEKKAVSGAAKHVQSSRLFQIMQPELPQNHFSNNVDFKYSNKKHFEKQHSDGFGARASLAGAGAAGSPFENKNNRLNSASTIDYTTPRSVENRYRY